MLVQLVWGFTPSASRVVLDYLPVELYAAVRYSVSGLIFLSFTWLRYRRFQCRVRNLPLLATLGILSYGINSLGTLYGLKLGGILNFAMASSLNAFITATMSLLLLREKASPAFAIAALLSILGGVLLALGKYDLSNAQVALGSLGLIWGAYVLEALGFVFSKRFKEKMPLAEYLGVAQMSAGIFMGFYSFSKGINPTLLLQMPARGLAALLFVCIVACCLCYFILYWLLNHVEGHRLAFFDCFHSVSAAIIGWLLFSEAFNAKMLAGGALLVGAVFVITISRSGGTMKGKTS